MSETIAIDGPENEAEDGSVYEMIRDDIISGRLGANERLKVAQIADRLGTSTNPVREALQQLRGEGFVVMTPNRGARVRPIDEEFIRDIIEIEMLIEPALTKWFVGMATETDIAELERIQAEIENNKITDNVNHTKLDTQFHLVIYGRHYNRHAAYLWWKHREILRAISRQYPMTLARRAAVLSEHREIIATIRKGDGEGAAAVVARHVEGSGRHILEQMRAVRSTQKLRGS